MRSSVRKHVFSEKRVFPQREREFGGLGGLCWRSWAARRAYVSGLGGLKPLLGSVLAVLGGFGPLQGPLWAVWGRSGVALGPPWAVWDGSGDAPGPQGAGAQF